MSGYAHDICLSRGARFRHLLVKKPFSLELFDHQDARRSRMAKSRRQQVLFDGGGALLLGIRSAGLDRVT